MADVTDLSVPEQIPAEQSRYQVRFDFGAAGLTRLRAADILVWVDSLPGPASVPDFADLDEHTAVVLGSLATRSAVAEWILQRQISAGRRLSIALVGAGFEEGFASHDFLAAGAIVDALAARGIDYSSPEAAIAASAYQGLTNAVGHLFTASVVGQIVRDREGIDLVRDAARVDSVAEIIVLRESDLVAAPAA